MHRRAILAVSLLVVFAGCDLPRDPEGTSERVRGGALRVGVLAGNAEAEAADRAIVAALAEALGAAPAFTGGDAHALFYALNEGELDLIIGGLPASTSFAKHAGLSREAGPLIGPGESERRVLSVRPGENGFLLEVNRAIRRHREGGGV